MKYLYWVLDLVQTVWFKHFQLVRWVWSMVLALENKLEKPIHTFSFQPHFWLARRLPLEANILHNTQVSWRNFARVIAEIDGTIRSTMPLEWDAKRLLSLESEWDGSPMLRGLTWQSLWVCVDDLDGQIGRIQKSY